VIKIRGKLKSEYDNFKLIMEEEDLDLEKFSSIFNPNYLDKAVYFPYFLKDNLSTDEIKSLAKSVVNYLLLEYNKRFIQYLEEEHSLKINEVVLDNLDKRTDLYNKDKVFSWVMDKGLRHLNDSLNYICVDTEEKLLDLIKITDLQLGFSSGTTKEDLIRWLYEIPLSYKKRLENNLITNHTSSF